jgi:hypothetical protein
VPSLECHITEQPVDLSFRDTVEAVGTLFRSFAGPPVTTSLRGLESARWIRGMRFTMLACPTRFRTKRARIH